MVNPGPSSAVIVPKGTVPGMPELEPDLESRNIFELRKHCEEKIKKQKKKEEVRKRIKIGGRMKNEILKEERNHKIKRDETKE